MPPRFSVRIDVADRRFDGRRRTLVAVPDGAAKRRSVRNFAHVCISCAARRRSRAAIGQAGRRRKAAGRKLPAGRPARSSLPESYRDGLHVQRAIHSNLREV